MIEMNSLQLLLLCAFIGLVSTQWNLECKIQVKFRNDAHKKIRIDLLVPSLSIMSDPVILDAWKHEKSVHVSFAFCRLSWYIPVFFSDQGKKLRAEAMGIHDLRMARRQMGSQEEDSIQVHWKRMVPDSCWWWVYSQCTRQTRNRVLRGKLRKVNKRNSNNKTDNKIVSFIHQFQL